MIEGDEANPVPLTASMEMIHYDQSMVDGLSKAEKERFFEMLWEEHDKLAPR